MRVGNEKLEVKDVALVLQGGGSRGAFTAGFLDVLLENGIVFPYVIGTSAGALNAINYLSEDQGRGKIVTTKKVRDKRFLSTKNLIFKGGAFNFDYLFNELPKTLGFSQDVYDKSNIEFECAATSMENGQVAYFNKKDYDDKTFKAALAASSSLPLLAQPVEVQGHLYFDGGVVAAIPWRRPLELGYRKIVVVLTRNKDFRKGNSKRSLGKTALYFLKYHKHKKFYEAIKTAPHRYDQDIIAVNSLSENQLAIPIYLETKSKIKSTEKRERILLSLYDQGREQAKKHLGEIKEFAGLKDDQTGESEKANQ